MQLNAKLFIKGKIKVLTGLTVGTARSDIEIGGIDNSVVKTSEGVPYIPGSSLKGKMRSLLERMDMDEIYKRKTNVELQKKLDNMKETPSEEYKNKLKEEIEKEVKKKNPMCNCGKCDICTIFGTSADTNSEDSMGPTRLYVNDAFLSDDTKKKMANEEDEFSSLELKYTEGKWENTIDRKTSKANHPRQTERVPRGAEFDFDMVYNVFIENEKDYPFDLEKGNNLSKTDVDRFSKVIEAMSLLEDDYLGGNGSRGYGRIAFEKIEIALKDKKIYEQNGDAKPIYKKEFKIKDFKSKCFKTAYEGQISIPKEDQ